MNRSAVEHHSLLPFMQPLARTRVRFRLLAAAGDLASCQLTCWKRSQPQSRRTYAMQTRYQDECKTEWVVDVSFPQEAHYVKYFFTLTGRDGEVLRYGEHGFFQEDPSQGFFELLQVQEADVPALPQWAQGCVFYQIFPERFAVGNPSKALRNYEPWNARPTRENFLGGDLPGIQAKLPYLRELGVECLYLTPVFAADFNHKYATADYFHVDPDFGTDEDLTALVEAAHAQGIRVVLDGVFNHVGIRFPPFADLLSKGEESAYRDWFYPKRFPLSIDPDCYECVGDYPYMPRLRVANPAVRRYVLEVLIHWLEKANIDGWRFDVADELDAGAVRYWRERVKARFPDALLLAETWGDARRLVAEGDQFDCAMNYLFRDAMVDYFAKAAISETTLDHRLQRMLMKYPEGVNQRMYNCLGSHDTARFLTECGGDKKRLRLALAFQLLFLGSPALYYGDEVGMEGGNDPGCRGGMRWEGGDRELLETARRFIAMRKEHPALRRGGYRCALAEDQRHLFAFERFCEEERALVIFNSGDGPQYVDFADFGGRVDIPPQSVKIVIK